MDYGTEIKRDVQVEGKNVDEDKFKKRYQGSKHKEFYYVLEFCLLVVVQVEKTTQYWEVGTCTIQNKI